MEIIRRYTAGESNAALAKEFGSHVNIIRPILVKAGVENPWRWRS
jgi:hypothetical protein